MATLGTAYVQVIPSTAGISTKLQQGVGAAAVPAGQKGGMLIGSAMKKFIGAAAIGLAIKKSVEEGAKLEQSLGGVETLYGKHAQKVIDNASKAYRTAGLSANDYMEQSTKFAASLLQSLGGDTKAAAKYADMAIIDMSDNANKFGTNITDIQNAYQGFAKQNYTMLDNLKLGYGGTKSEMERLLADASKISGQEYDISNLNDVYDAIHVIQTEMGVTGTTSKEAASTLSGSFASMKSAATNFLGNLSLGKNISSSMRELVTSASTFLFNNLIPALINIATSLPGALFSALKTAIPTFIGMLPSLITQIFNAATKIVSRVSGFLDGFLDNLVNDPGAPKAGLQIVKKIALALIKGSVILLKAGIKLAITIPRFIGRLLKSLFSSVSRTVGTKVRGIVNTVRTKFAAVKNAFLNPVKIAKNKLFNMIIAIKNRFNRIKLKLKLKIPKVSLSGGKAPWGIGGQGKLPSFRVRWAAKGGIVDGATLIGAGEKGAEAIVPLDPFWSKMDSIAKSIQTSNSEQSAAAGGVLNVVFTVGEEVVGRSAVNYINGQTIQFGASPINV